MKLRILASGLLAAAIVAAAGTSIATRRPARLWQTEAEKAAIRATFALQIAEQGYARTNAGFFDELECLHQPASCLPEYSGEPFLPADFDVAARAAGYRFTFYRGPGSGHWGGDSRSLSPSGLESYAFIASPPSPNWFGPRTICVDAAERVCISSKALDGTGGTCPVECENERQ